MKTKNYIFHLCTIVVFIMMFTSGAYGQSNYTSEELFTVPWGEGVGEIPINWVDIDYFTMPPVPVAVSEAAGIIFYNTNGHFTRYSIDGSVITETPSINLSHIAINDAGAFLCSDTIRLHYFNSDLQYISPILIQEENSYRLLIKRIFPSDDGNFWCIYGNVKDGIRRAYLIKVFTDGTLSDPTLVHEAPSQEPSTYKYVSPDGVVSSKVTDIYGYTYYTYREFQVGNAIVNLWKWSPEKELVHSNQIQNDPACEGIADYFIMHTGNYFTWHGSADGMVLTKYTLNHDPVCDLIVVTPMPYQGPSPAAIEFDASNTYDPNPDDELTFEWDFDGDGVFNEPVDDAYTGDQNHPTHEYTQNYDGFVTMRVTDNHEGECDSPAYISVVIQ